METRMSATGEWFAEHIEKLETWAKALFGHADPAVAAVQADIEKTATELKGDAVTVEHEAETDAEKVASDAERVAAPVAEEAVKAAEGLAGEAAADLAKDA